MKVSIIKKYPVRQHLINLAAMLLLALLITLFIFDSRDEGFRIFIISYVWALAICLTQSLGHSYIYKLLDKKYSWQEHLVKRAIFGSLAIIGYSAIAYLAVQMIMFMLVYGALPENPIYWALRTSYIAILISFLVSATFVLIAFFQNWKKSLLEAERFKAEMLQYKYEALQNQINPHFLFNSFNVLSDLVYEDQKKAVAFISQMSQLFRYVLDSRDKELVPITEELEFINAYTYLLQTRFEDKLSIRQDFKAKEDEMIVPMTLQLLIENCVKHNEISGNQALTVHISRKGEYLKVENNLQLKAASSESKKTGLANIRQQYSYFTDRKIVIGESDKHFSVEVPIIKWDKQ